MYPEDRAGQRGRDRAEKEQLRSMLPRQLLYAELAAVGRFRWQPASAYPRFGKEDWKQSR